MGDFGVWGWKKIKRLARKPPTTQTTRGTCRRGAKIVSQKTGFFCDLPRPKWQKPLFEGRFGAKPSPAPIRASLDPYLQLMSSLVCLTNALRAAVSVPNR